MGLSSGTIYHIYLKYWDRHMLNPFSLNMVFYRADWDLSVNEHISRKISHGNIHLSSL